MHHAFMLARKLLKKHKGSNKQILMITDGEPTSHLEGNYSFFDYPPHPKTIRETLNQVNLCTRERITINTFMLEASQYLINFVEKLTKMNQGRAFYSTPEKLGEYLVVDFVNNRRSRIN